MSEPLYIDRGAEFDDTERYRFRLWRTWGFGAAVLWIMLNPSTADAYELDPTLKKVLGFSERMGFEKFFVGNVYGLRTTDPKGLWDVDDPVGPGNLMAIEAMAAESELVMVGWGTHAKPDDVEAVASVLERVVKPVECLRVTKHGHPEHPLYVPYATTPQPYPYPWRPTA